MEVLAVIKLMILITIIDVATSSESCDCNDCRSEFRKRGYIPKYADGVKYTNLEVRYLNKPVKCGQTVGTVLNGAALPPTLKFDAKGRCENFSVIALLPDAFFNPPYPLWIVHNIPSKAMEKGWSNGGQIYDYLLKGKQPGDVRAPYIVPDNVNEDVGIGHEAIIFFVYCQCRYISDLRRMNRVERLGSYFDIKKYAKDHGLKCPIAGLFVQTSLTGLLRLPKIITIAPVNLPVNTAKLAPFALPV